MKKIIIFCLVLLGTSQVGFSQIIPLNWGISTTPYWSMSYSTTRSILIEDRQYFEEKQENGTNIIYYQEKGNLRRIDTWLYFKGGKLIMTEYEADLTKCYCSVPDLASLGAVASKTKNNWIHEIRNAFITQTVKGNRVSIEQTPWDPSKCR